MNAEQFVFKIFRFWISAWTLRVWTATFVAEFFAASALHMITALSLFDPEFAVWALLTFWFFDKTLELFVGFFFNIFLSLFVLLASHPSMEWNLTIKAIMLVAFFTVVLFCLCGLVFNRKCVVAFWIWTPNYVILATYSFHKGELFVLLYQFGGQYLFNIWLG